MRAVVQRVREARVRVEGNIAGEIGAGLLVLLGVGRSDKTEAARALAEKTVHLRVFSDEQGKMNRSLIETRGAALVVSQFTLYGDARGGRRPSYVEAASPEHAKQLYEGYVAALRALGVSVATGVFQAHMEVESINDGPVTLLLDSDKQF
ncbi:MAG TPA: D-aminoacyl-tRNA deacylase [Methylomirabilota bacterium]|nr:D-aminoacyl-tRNA deacylase [Methylomirabilota bacterium]